MARGMLKRGAKVFRGSRTFVKGTEEPGTSQTSGTC